MHDFRVYNIKRHEKTEKIRAGLGLGWGWLAQGSEYIRPCGRSMRALVAHRDQYKSQNTPTIELHSSRLEFPAEKEVEKLREYSI